MTDQMPLNLVVNQYIRETDADASWSWIRNTQSTDDENGNITVTETRFDEKFNPVGKLTSIYDQTSAKIEDSEQSFVVIEEDATRDLTKSGSRIEYSDSGDIESAFAWSYDYLENDFVGGTETLNGLVITLDSDWTIVSKQAEALQDYAVQLEIDAVSNLPLGMSENSTDKTNIWIRSEGLTNYYFDGITRDLLGTSEANSDNSIIHYFDAGEELLASSRNENGEIEFIETRDLSESSYVEVGSVTNGAGVVLRTWEYNFVRTSPSDEWQFDGGIETQDGLTTTVNADFTVASQTSDLNVDQLFEVNGSIFNELTSGKVYSSPVSGDETTYFSLDDGILNYLGTSVSDVSGRETFF